MKQTESTTLTGLTSEEVAQRVARGEVNVDAGVKTRSIGEICRDNICTLFNAVNVILAAFVFITGSYKNMLFMGVIICNIVIGIFQEIRSKINTDRLTIVAASKVKVLRDGATVDLPFDELVRDDIIQLGRGDQIPADSVVVDGVCNVNESLLTGESHQIKKRAGDQLMSGSFVNDGVIYARVVHVGAENYAAKITAEAKQHKAVNSEIMISVNKIIKFVSCIIFPMGAALFCREHFASGTPVDETILSTVSALVGMIPEGLILLTSTVLAVAVVRLSRNQVLVQQLYCIETLARVDTLCLDKTGTITTGKMEVARVEPIVGAVAAGKADAQDADGARLMYGAGMLELEANRAFASIAAADPDPNETAQAIQAYYRLHADVVPLKVTRAVPFNSDRKWSGATLENGYSYVMGAGQFVLGEAFAQVQEQFNKLAAEARVMVLARVEGFDENDGMIGKPEALAFIAIHDQIRDTAAQTIAYFKEQGVNLKVISGDDPHTVSHIAELVGVPNADKFVDATTLHTEEEIEKAILECSVFGRVRPDQKKAFVVALQKHGHIVAMTGDGVNDTLALKQADCSIAMASGSDAARNVAHLVLVNNDFASMPKVVAEGRRSINNLQRSASLFLVKTLMSMVLAVLFIIFPWQYPFQPIQMTLVSAFTIGLPSFVLALEPNKDRIKGHFLENVIVRSIPSAAMVVLCIVAINAIGYLALGFTYEQVATLCVLIMAWVGFLLIIRLSIPFTFIRGLLLVVVVGGVFLGTTLFPTLFCMEPFTVEMAILLGAMAALSVVCFNALYHVIDRWYSERQAKLV